MKILILISGLILSMNTYATNMGWVAMTKKILKQHAEECKVADIKVEEIVKNSHIKGHVTGLAETSLEDFKVLFYVKTNKWYVHPYQFNHNQPSGYSWAELTAGGKFWNRSVFRTPSKKMAVILVPSPHIVPNKSRSLKSLTKYACKYIEIPGNGDFSP
jgi:hypothetical protein